MSDSNREGSPLGQEDVYKFTTYTALEKALENNGWKKDKVHQFFRSLPKELTDSFPERSMTRTELKEYASKLDAAQTRYEQINLLKQVALKGLKEEIGATISFENLGDLEAALKERRVNYPKGYLEQTGSSFLNGWGTSRSLTMTSYESMIKVLKASENEEEYVRGQIIAKAFNTPIEQKVVPNDTVKEVYPDKNTAFSQSIKDAKNFPFSVKYSENGKSYELPISTHKNTIIFGEKTITLTNGQISIQSIAISGDSFIINGKRGLISGTETISKEKFISDILPKFLSNTSSSIDLSGYRFQIGINGTENAREISTSSSVVESTTEAESINEKNPEFINALKMALSSNKSLPFTFSYMENGKEMTSKFDATSDTFFIGNKKYTLQSKDFNFLSISIDNQSIHFGTTQNMPSGEKLTSISKYSKKEFIDGFLPNMLAGKEVLFSGKPLSFKVESSTTTGAVSGVEANNSLAVPPQSPKTSHEVMKYSLGAYEGYALRHLNRAGKTITDLQNALIEKNIPVNPTGIFDQQTLDAVFAFQKTIPNPIFQPDGLIGSRETIPALFGIASMPNIDRETSRTSTRRVARNTTDQAIATPVSNQRESRGLSFDEKMSQLSSYFKENGYTQTPGKLFWKKDGESPFHIFINADKQSISITDAQNKPLTGVYTPEQISAYNHIAEKIGISLLPLGSGGVLNVPSSTPRESSLSPVQEIESRYSDFKTYASSIDKWFGGFRDTKEDIEKYRIELNKRIATLLQVLQVHENNPTLRDRIAGIRYNLSLYLVGDLPNVENNHYKNILSAQNLAISVLNQDQKRIEPIPDGREALFITLDSIRGTSLGDDIAYAMERYPEKSLGEILSNPLIKGGWETAYGKIFEKSLSGLDASLSHIDTSKLTSIQQKALFHLKDIRGKNAWYDLKTENTTAMWQLFKGGSAIVAGGLMTYVSMGTLGAIGAVTAGAGVATVGGVLARGYWNNAETGLDFGVNLLSFGGGVLVVKLGNTVRGTSLIQSAGKAGTVGTLVGIDMVGNIGIGIAGDSIRASLHGEDLNTWDSLKQNAIPWAIMAILFHKQFGNVPKSTLHAAQDVEKAVEKAGILARLGKPVKNQLDIIKSKLPELEKWKKSKETPTKNPKPNDSGDAPKAPEAPKDFSTYLTQLIPAKNKLKGVIVDTPDLKISAHGGDKYQVIHGKNIYEFDSHADMVKGVSKMMNDPKGQMTLLSKIQQANIKSLDQTEISAGLRFSTKDGEINFQKKDPTTGGWVKAELKDISDDDAIKALSTITGRNPTQIKQAMTEASHAKIDDHVSSKEKENFIKKHGKNAWAGLESGFDRAMMTMKEAPGAALKGTLGVLKFVTGWNSKQGWIQSFLFGGIIPQTFEGIAFGNGTDEDELNMKNTGEALAFATVYKFFGIRGSLIAGILYTYSKYDSVSTPDAQPPLPEKTPSDTPENRVNTSPSTETIDQPSIMPSQETPSGATI